MALPTAITKMYVAKGVVKEYLGHFVKDLPVKYLNIREASHAFIASEIGALANRDYYGQPIVPENLKELRLPEDQYGRHTTEFSKKIGKILHVSPGLFECILNGHTGGLYVRFAHVMENSGDFSRIAEGRGIPVIETLFFSPSC